MGNGDLESDSLGKCEMLRAQMLESSYYALWCFQAGACDWTGMHKGSKTVFFEHIVYF